MVVPQTQSPIRATFQDAFFRCIHRRHLIYNASWEDPRVDRALLGIDSRSKVVVITGGGCNTLDYLLDDPAEIHAVDVNPTQNALLHLKAALLRRGDFDELYEMFGRGTHRSPRRLLDSLRAYLPDFTLRFWREKESYFQPTGLRNSFYYRGTAGAAAWLFRGIMLRAKSDIRDLVFELFDARDLREQRRLFSMIEPVIWDRTTAWLLNQPVTLTLFGVPRPQVRLIDRTEVGGVASYVRRKLKHVLTNVLIRENYFWRVYVHGHYVSTCCPSYLKPANHAALRDRVERIRTHDQTLSSFLADHPGRYTHFVLLDHQDWLAHNPAALHQEWQRILANAERGAKILMRSAGLAVDFIPRFARNGLRFFPDWTSRMQEHDRVGTYGSTHLAEVV